MGPGTCMQVSGPGDSCIVNPSVNVCVAGYECMVPADAPPGAPGTCEPILEPKGPGESCEMNPSVEVCVAGYECKVPAGAPPGHPGTCLPTLRVNCGGHFAPS